MNIWSSWLKSSSRRTLEMFNARHVQSFMAIAAMFILGVLSTISRLGKISKSSFPQLKDVGHTHVMLKILNP